MHYESFVRVLAEEEIVWPAGDDPDRFLGVHDRACFRIVFEEAGRSFSSQLCEELVERKSRYFTSGLADVRLFPGARQLVAEANRRAATTIVSGGRRGEIEIVLRAHDLLDHFPWMVTADDRLEAKPHPECFLRALEELRQRGLADLEPRECLVFEDSFRGVEAALRAGMRCVAVTHTVEASRLTEADRVIESLQEWEW